MKPSQPARRQDTQGFSLVEVLVSTALIMLILLTLVSMVNFSAHTWTYTNSKIEQFRDARDAFESVTRRLSQATLNTYWDYQGDATTGNVTAYIRLSELRFISGPGVAGTADGSHPRPTHSVFFQAPLGITSGTTVTNYADLQTMLNTVGYYIEFSSDEKLRPPCVVTARPGNVNYRFRLMEMVEPAESLTLYTYTSGTDDNGKRKATTYKNTDWFTAPLNKITPLGIPEYSRVVADNVVALVLLPKRSVQEDSTGKALCPNYSYNSAKTDDADDATVDAKINWKNQLPPVVQVTMVAVDEASYNRYQNGSTTPALMATLGNLFTTVGDTQDANSTGYAYDLKKLTTALRAAKINYRVFTTDVAIRGAKWSTVQTN